MRFDVEILFLYKFNAFGGYSQGTYNSKRANSSVVERCALWFRGQGFKSPLDYFLFFFSKPDPANPIFEQFCRLQLVD